MTESLYWAILNISNGLLMFLGLHLIFGEVSKEIKGSKYHTARKTAGICFAVTPLSDFIYYLLKINNYGSGILATAVNLTSYYTTAVLISFFATSYYWTQIGRIAKNP